MRKQKASETRFLSTFDGFGRHLGLPKRSQDAQKSMLKRHQNLISFWRPLGTRLFRPKRRQDAPAPQITAEDGVGPRLLGEDLGGGNKNLREEESRRRMGGRIRRPRVLVSHADPVGRRIVEGCALVPPRQFIRISGGSGALPGMVFGGLGGVLGGLGGVLGGLEGKLGALGAILVASLAVLGDLGRSWGRLGRSWGSLGGSWCGFGGRHKAVWRRLGANLKPKWSQVGIKVW